MKRNFRSQPASAGRPEPHHVCVASGRLFVIRKGAVAVGCICGNDREILLLASPGDLHDERLVGRNIKGGVDYVVRARDITLTDA